MKFRIVLTSLCFLIAASTVLAVEESTEIRLKAGEVYHTDPNANWHFSNRNMYVGSGRYQQDENGITGVGMYPVENESLLYVLNGAVRYNTLDDHRTVEKDEMLYLSETGRGSIRGLVKDTQVLYIRLKSKAREWRRSHLPGAVFSFEDLQYASIDESTTARIVRMGRGHAAAVRIAPKGMLVEKKAGTGMCWLVTRGGAEASVNGKACQLNEHDLLYLRKRDTISMRAGEQGFDAILVSSGVNDILNAAYDSRLESLSTVIAPGTFPKLLIDGSAIEPGLTFTEGPSWMNGRFYFSNYYWYWKDFRSSDEGGVWEYNPEDGSHRILNSLIQTCGTTPLANGKLAVCDLFQRGIVEMDVESGRMGDIIVNDYEGVPFAVANDVITDRKGGMYITDSSVAKKGPKQPGTALYYRSRDGRMSRVTEPDAVKYINGIALTTDDKRLYLTGSGEKYVFAFDVAPDGSLSNKRPFARLFSPDSRWRKGNPSSNADGMTIDSEGNIYIATALGIQVFDNKGGYLGILKFPQSPSHCVFGGNDLTTLYVTARDHVYSIQTLKIGLQYPLPPLEK